MTEKTAYITASIKLLEKRDELNSDELAVLCNLKKFMYQSNPQPAFAVGEYYSFIDLGKTEIFKVLSISDLGNKMKVKSYRTNIDMFTEYETYTTGNALAVTDSKPATAGQIATFCLAEHFASKGRKMDCILLKGLGLR